jgi:phenylalanyl-tRNA synthetase beta chain
MKVVHQWLKDYVGESLGTPEEIGELLTFHAFEIEGVEKVGEHEVIEVKILPDRASDCLSHRGIAREIASITGIPLVSDPFTNDEKLPPLQSILVDIQDTHACSRFGAALITGIEVKESPKWLQERLRALGQRPINNIVDATNYVMYSLGQPLHAYDADKFPQVDGKWQFQVRFAQPQETVSLIAEGGKNEDRIVELTGTELLIVDGSSNLPIGLAGVKGGKYAGVDATTSKIIIEGAHFDPIITRKTARGLGIVIDASKRFENNPSKELGPYALREIVALIKDIAGGVCEGAIDVYPEPQKAKDVVLEVSKVNSLLGLSLSKELMVDILNRIGAKVIDNGDTLTLTSPWERTDLTIPADYIEEIGRINGYAEVVSVVPATVPLSEINVRHYYSEKVRNILTEVGFSEVITSSFLKKDVIQLQNALASDKSYVRSSLRKNVLETLDKNAGHTDVLGIPDIRVFEIGTVFNQAGKGIAEHISLCIGIRTKANGYVQADDTAVSKTIEALEREFGVGMSFTVEKGVAECNFTDVLTKLTVPTSYETVAVSEEISYKPFSLYPAVTRDIALWVTEGTSASEVETVINEHAGNLRIRTTLFDEFTKDSRTSFAFRLVFQSLEKTLTDEEVNVVMDLVYTAVTKKGWETR